MNRNLASALVGIATLTVTSPVNVRAQSQPTSEPSFGSISSLTSSGRAAADYKGGGTSGNWSGATGFWFSLNNPIQVTGLGFYDLTGSGLASSHDVGIFQADGTLVVSAVIDSGTVDPLIAGTIGGTRVKTVTPIVLTTGQLYFCIADNLNVDQYTYGNGAVTFASDLNWVSYGDLASNSIFSGIPSKPGGQSGNLDGTFVYTTIPEPVASVLLLGFGLFSGALGRKRRK